MSPLSPLNTPATLHAQRIASRGLEAAEALEEVDHVAAATMKAEALRDASEAYSRRRAAQVKSFRSPLASLGNQQKGVLNRSSNSKPYALYQAHQPLSPAQHTVSEEGEEAEQEEDGPILEENHILRNGGESYAGMIPSDAGLVDLRDITAYYEVAYEPVFAPLTPDHIQAIVISGASVVRHLEGGDFCLYQLHVPLMREEQTEHVAFKRYRDFLELDELLCEALNESFNPLTPCLFFRELPHLPPKTIPWLQDATHGKVVAKRWAALQRYLDVALEKAACSPGAFFVLKRFLCLQ